MIDIIDLEINKADKKICVLLSKTQIVAGVTGLEPAISGLTGQRDNQLRYTPRCCQNVS